MPWVALVWKNSTACLMLKFFVLISLLGRYGRCQPSFFHVRVDVSAHGFLPSRF